MARDGSNPKRRILAAGTIDPGVLQELSGRVGYVGSANHKRFPSNYGFHPPSNPRAWKSMCDAHRIVPKQEAQSLLAKGVLKGMVSTLGSDGLPKYIWSVDEDGAAYEAKVGNGGYHGYRLDADDLMGDLVRANWARR